MHYRTAIFFSSELIVPSKIPVDFIEDDFANVQPRQV